MTKAAISKTTKQVQKTPVVAAIDLGTNSCRLLVARLEPAGLKVIDSFSRVVRLGEGVQVTGKLASSAIDRAVEALRICKIKVKDNQVEILRAVTTEACRRASNANELVERIKKELDFDLEIISSAEEARLALSGCSGVLSPLREYAIAFDIGGGSTEVMWLHIPRDSGPTIYPQLPGYLSHEIPDLIVLDWVSLPYGVVTLSETYGDYITDTNIFHEISDKISANLQEFSRKNDIEYYIDNQSVQMVGTSGTVTTLAALHLGLARYDRRLIDGAYLDLEAVTQVSTSILHMGQQGRLTHPCIGSGRADLVVSGAAILEGICQTWKLQQLRVADRGVREGILLDLVRQYIKNNKK